MMWYGIRPFQGLGAYWYHKAINQSQKQELSVLPPCKCDDAARQKVVTLMYAVVREGIARPFLFSERRC
jgi:hypothetical protein